MAGVRQAADLFLPGDGPTLIELPEPTARQFEMCARKQVIRMQAGFVGYAGGRNRGASTSGVRAAHSLGFDIPAVHSCRWVDHHRNVVNFPASD
jgi:hypothetical protein